MSPVSKDKTVFYCQGCGYQSPRWLGRCPDCGEWNTLVEERLEPKSRWKTEGKITPSATAKPLSEIALSAEHRTQTGWNEFDRVMGGGIVKGSITLIGGDPGIGKSTLMLQVLAALPQGITLYVSGEESVAQVKMRAERLGIHASSIYLLSETSLEEILRQAEEMRPALIVIDSIQTVYTTAVSSAPGSVTQIREVTAQLMFYAKSSGTVVFLIGHVTKEGAIAGPRVLEHIVDTVLYFEGDKSHAFRLLRAIKNRFGSTHELGVFEMKESGLVQVENPSGLFLSERMNDVIGSVIVATQEGTRPILVELQALATPSHFGMARRMALGVEMNRVSLLLAVLEKQAGMQISGYDVFINVVGGMKIEEPAIDLGVIMAVVSSFKERAIHAGTIVFGEVGLSGEVRAVSQPQMRIREAEALGFTRCILPKRNEAALVRDGFHCGIACVWIARLEEALALF